MPDYSLQSLNITPGEFLGAFFEASERVCLRVFSDKPGSAFSGLKLETEQGHFDKISDVLHKHNTGDRGIYFVINYGGPEDITTSSGSTPNLWNVMIFCWRNIWPKFRRSPCRLP